MRSRYLDAHVEIEWFSYDSKKRARAEHLQHVVLKHRWSSKALMLKCLHYYCVWYGFDMFVRAWALYCFAGDYENRVLHVHECARRQGESRILKRNRPPSLQLLETFKRKVRGAKARAQF